MQRALAAMMIATVLFAGCLDSQPNDEGTTPPSPPMEPAKRYPLPEDPMPEGAGHDHTSVAQHKFLWNYDFTARDPLLQNQAQIAGVHALDLQAGHLFGAVYGANTVAINGGLAIWDLADPAVPNLVGRVNIPGAVGGDRSMEATNDGNYVVMGTEPVTCLGQVNPVPIGVYLFDTRDKSLPTIADVLTVGGVGRGNPGNFGAGGAHSIAVHEINDRNFVFIQGDIYEIAPDEQTGAKLINTGASITVNHDLYLRDTPWGDVWALTANGGGGMTIHNVTDPFNPVLIGQWNLPDRGSLAEEYYFHTADVGFFDDQIIVILSSEDWLDHVSPMWILDGTPMQDFNGTPFDLEWIGTWANPGNHTAIGTSFSLHNPRFHEDGILTISTYHGGLWQLDFRHPDLRADPAEIAYAVYAEGTQTVAQDPVHQTIESTLCGLGLTLDAPTYMDVERGPDGHLYAADVYMGMYTFTPSADHPVYALS